MDYIQHIFFLSSRETDTHKYCLYAESFPSLISSLFSPKLRGKQVIHTKMYIWHTTCLETIQFLDSAVL